MTLRFQSLDPRCRLLCIVAGTAIVASTPPGAHRPFLAYLAILALLWLAGGVGLSPWLRRTLGAAPFVLLAAALLALREGPSPAVAAVLWKGLLAAGLLSVLTLATPLPELLWALRKLWAPESLGLILTLMSRYVQLLREEWTRMARARESRSVLPTHRIPRAILIRQFGALLLRSSDRAERVYAAMLSRGFDGTWPIPSRPPFGLADALFLGLVIAAFLLARIAS